MELNALPYVPAFWYSSNNFGDCLNHFLISRLSGKPVVLSDRLKEHYTVCGSILTEANQFSTVWGAGFSWEHMQPYDRDATYVAVRGNLSAERLEKSVKYVGDPALLLPLLHTPPSGKKHLHGIIPHWSEVEYYINQYPGIHIVDPMQSVTDFINDVVSCEKVISSSLHGLIVADAYGIPNAWHAGAPKDWFKYFDYYTTTDKTHFEPFTAIDFDVCEVHEYRYNKTELLNTCPFLKHGTN